MRLGLLVLDRHALVGEERSAAADEWLGPFTAGSRFTDALARIDPELARWFDAGWAEVLEGALPLEITLAQLPVRVETQGRVLELAYAPIEAHGRRLDELLVVISDVTDTLARARLEAKQREHARTSTIVTTHVDAA